MSSSRLTIAGYLLTAAALWLILELHLLPALFAGLLVYALINALAPSLQRRLPGARAHGIVVALLAALVAAILALAIVALVAFVNSKDGDPTQMFERVSPLLDRARSQLPAFIVDRLPDDSEGMRAALLEWLRVHAAVLQLAGKRAARLIVHLLIGIVLGAILALYNARQRPQGGPLTIVLASRCATFASAFRDVVFAQMKISALNTLLTGIFLLIGLPLFGVHLPFAKTLLIATLVVGLLPVIGNLVSNTLIVVVALSISLSVAVAALIFLLVIHKLEYFLSARIVGAQIRASAWELLIAMLLMESIFGLAGLIAAPIYYAYLKRELAAARLI